MTDSRKPMAAVAHPRGLLPPSRQAWRPGTNAHPIAIDNVGYWGRRTGFLAEGYPRQRVRLRQSLKPDLAERPDAVRYSGWAHGRPRRCLILIRPPLLHQAHRRVFGGAQQWSPAAPAA